MKAAVYIGKDDGDLFWGIMSDQLPPGINQMYSVGTTAAGVAGSAAETTTGAAGLCVQNSPMGFKKKNEKRRAAFYLSSKASEWKNTVGQTIVKAAFNGGGYDGPCCALLHLFVFENYDTDNRLKLMNDTLQGAIITNDRNIRRSAQFKTVVKRRADIGFMYCIAPQRKFYSLLDSFTGFADTIEGADGILSDIYEKKAHGAIVDFLGHGLSMERRLSCGI